MTGRKQYQLIFQYLIIFDKSTIVARFYILQKESDCRAKKLQISSNFDILRIIHINFIVVFNYNKSARSSLTFSRFKIL